MDSEKLNYKDYNVKVDFHRLLAHKTNTTVVAMLTCSIISKMTLFSHYDVTDLSCIFTFSF